MSDLSFQDHLILARQSSRLEHLIQVAASYQEENKILFDECMKEATVCQQIIDHINKNQAA